jgi:outer membrane protein TolC
MNHVSPGRGHRRAASVAVGFAVGLVAATAGAASLISDPLGTRSVLESNAHGFADPGDPACALPAGPLALGQAIGLALCRNPATKGAWAAARLQAAELGIAEAARFPTIDATGSDSWIKGPRLSSTGTALVDGSQRTEDAALNLSYTLFDFGARHARIASARHLLDAAAATANSVAQQVVLGAVEAYYGVVAADGALGAAKSAEAAAAHSLEVARGRRDAGVATRADVLQAETAFDQAVLSRVQAAGALKGAHGTLAVTLGAPADRAFELAADPVPAEVPLLSARIADLMAEAARQRPDLAAAQAQRDAAAADVTAARATGRPVISVGAARNFVQMPGFPNQNYNTLALSVTVPVFTGFDTLYRVRAAQATLAAREANAEQIRLQVSLDVWNAYASLDSANQQLKATAALLASARENEEVALGRYQAGVGTIVDVLTAQSAAAGARQQRIGAEQSWQLARAELALSIGRLTSAEPLATAGAGP